jgi:hypothetical protein
VKNYRNLQSSYEIKLLCSPVPDKKTKTHIFENTKGKRKHIDLKNCRRTKTKTRTWRKNELRSKGEK